MTFRELFNGTQQTTIDSDDRFTTGKPSLVGSKWISRNNFIAWLGTYFVNLTGIQSITAVKTFTVSPQVPNPTGANDAVNLASLSAATAGVMLKNVALNVNSAYSFNLLANHKIMGCDILPVSGTTNVRIGTSANASDIMSDKEVIAPADIRPISLNDASMNARTIHVTPTGGGTVSINVWYIPSIY